jgi:hypothetical protein
MLIIAAVFVLMKRNVAWGRLLSRNKWLWIYFMYCGASIFWSDYPFVCFKRWVKELGNPIMILVILTEEKPYEAIGVLIRRLSFLWMPSSLLFCKYYPDLGRAYTPQGVQMLTGIGQQKNDLGLMCLVCGIYLSWKLVLIRNEGVKFTATGHMVELIMLALVFWLLHLSQSATSMVCLIVAVSLFLIGRSKLISAYPGRAINLFLVIVPMLMALDASFDIRESVLVALGRDSTMTARVPIWDLLLGLTGDPLVGVGYQSFWMGERLIYISQALQATINQAHNGYLEQFLNLGFIGVAFIVVIILSGLLKIRRHLFVDYHAAMLRLSFLFTAILYNITEASFYGLNNMWVLLLIAVMDVSAIQSLEEKMPAIGNA